jgi:hypothetical protein
MNKKIPVNVIVVNLLAIGLCSDDKIALKIVLSAINRQYNDKYNLKQS